MLENCSSRLRRAASADSIEGNSTTEQSQYVTSRKGREIEGQHIY
jgi:hypothetical protein